LKIQVLNKMESVLTTLQQKATNHEIKLANLFQAIFEHLKR
jgi:hypothetical protein